MALLVLLTACVLSAHSHLPCIPGGERISVPASPEDGPAIAPCSICSLFHHASFALAEPSHAGPDDLSPGLRRPLALPRVTELFTEERSPRAPPRADIG